MVLHTIGKWVHQVDIATRFKPLWVAGLALLILTGGLGCSSPPKKKTSLLDQFAEMLDEKAGFYWEKENAHWMPEARGFQLDFQVGRVEAVEKVPGKIQLALRNQFRATATGPKGQEVWNLLAREGWISPGADTIVLDKRVLVQADGSELEGDRLTWIPGSREVWLTGRVQLMASGMVLSGDSLLSNLGFDSYQLMRVESATSLDQLIGE